MILEEVLPCLQMAVRVMSPVCLLVCLPVEEKTRNGDKGEDNIDKSCMPNFYDGGGTRPKVTPNKINSRRAALVMEPEKNCPINVLDNEQSTARRSQNNLVSLSFNPHCTLSTNNVSLCLAHSHRYSKVPRVRQYSLYSCFLTMMRLRPVNELHRN